MGKKILVTGIVCIVLVFAMQFTAGAEAWKLEVENYSGYVSYEENETVSGLDLDSDWSAYINRTGLTFKGYDHEGFEGEVRTGFSFTTENSEKWDINDIECMTNDMKLWAWDAGFLLGWALPLDMNSADSELCFTPLIGYNYEFIRFTRTNFNILDVITVTEVVDIDYYLHALDLGGRIDFAVNEQLNFFVKPIYGFIVYDYVHNSTSGGVEGNGGSYYVNLDAGIEYDINKDWMIGLLFRAEWQRLSGGNRNNGVVWPANSLDTYGGAVNISYKF